MGSIIKSTFKLLFSRMSRVLPMAVVLVLAGSSFCWAQIYPLSAQFYHNEYLGNPSFAGIEKGYRLDFSHRTQWSDVPGAPVNQVFTAVLGTKRVGIGLNVQKDIEGLIDNVRALSTFAYHLPINDARQLHFGLSMGVLNQRVRNESLVGDQGDISVEKYNNKDFYVDGDFGMAYTAKKLKLQFSIPNLKSFFRSDNDQVANLALIYSAVSYKMSFGKGINQVSIEPKLGYRKVQKYKSILDLGTNVSLSNDRLSLLGIYHSPGNSTFGIGFNYNKALGMSAMYTTGTSALRRFNSTGDFEINLRFSFQ